MARGDLRTHFLDVRGWTEAVGAEDRQVRSTHVSPKWHLAHTSRLFDTSARTQ